MDTRLFESAWTGNVDDFHKLLRENPLILYTISLYSSKNPLHIASTAWHIGFVREILRLRPEYAKEVNKDGLSPLHMAAVNGHIEVLGELLNVDRKLCCLERRDNKTPLHFVAMKGRVDVIELVLDNETTTSGLLEVNAVNQSGLTALDVLQIFPSEAGDREIADILQRAGAVRARDVMISPIPSYESHSEVINHSRTQPRCQRQTDNLVEYFKFKKGRDSPSEARSDLLVIAVLVATATFQVELIPPGGTWQDSYSRNQNNGSSHHGAHSAGNSIMGTSSRIAFALFVVFNSLGFSMSLFMINILTSKFPLQFELQFCMVALFFTYNTTMTSIASGSVKLFTIIITSVFSAITLLTKLVKQLIKLFNKLVVDIIHKVA
ncbi:hypothetical protein CRYUN_Cryun07bG0010800 [Craigia yunnanensis]